MKKKIKIKNDKLPIETHGNWYDLKATETTILKAPHLEESGRIVFNNALLKLNLSIDLPKWYEIHIEPRSSAFKEFGIMMVNSGKGVVDGPDNDTKGYIGDGDVVRFHALPFRNLTVIRGDRIAQFKIVLNQKAPWWVKMRDLFYSGFEFEVVDILHNKNRGGHGTSGRN